MEALVLGIIALYQRLLSLVVDGRSVGPWKRLAFEALVLGIIALYQRLLSLVVDGRSVGPW
ncbi:hypothetical protein DTL42_16935 [Bremerella cremea]|uniref:Uncharacterized protein n=1 Tax=Bremerella cremea TaxID=1031537 RepID=A0A368KN83_9BACT|nr:hypothetical protein DTL42_16935 [Bremerella cremea]